MDLKQLTKKPQIVKVIIDAPEIIESVGEEVIFYMKDHLDLATYFDFYKLQQNQDINMLMDLMRRIVLSEDGTPAIADDELLPIDLAVAILTKINNQLGNSKAKAPTATDGPVPN